ncbi:MAG: geranylgeranyl reductase family protein [Anaerolineales bacterium]|nr:geranylgeranyl reductase family protein [Anaerolineales bacterium]
MPFERPDVIVVGAGPAGSALACLLAERGHGVLLLDKAEFPRDKTCGDGLSPRALRVLQQLDVLAEVNKSGYRINALKVFSPNGEHFTSPIPALAGYPDYALVLPRFQLDDILRRRAIAAGAEFRRATVSDLLRDAATCVVGVRADRAMLHARVVALATGASTAVLERAGLLTAPPALGRAARTYFANVRGLSDAVEFHFDSVPLPGYGWVFPTSATTANVGAGYFLRAGRRPLHATPRQTFDGFIANPYIASLLAEAQPTAPLKGYPLRFDFDRARTAWPGLYLVGEACGLVNPMTGEGIDFALESAEVAAEAIHRDLRTGVAPEAAARRYAHALRARFLSVFVNFGRVRDVYFRPWVLNRFVRAAQRHDELKLRLVNIALGHADPFSALTPRVLWRALAG